MSRQQDLTNELLKEIREALAAQPNSLTTIAQHVGEIKEVLLRLTQRPRNDLNRPLDPQIVALERRITAVEATLGEYERWFREASEGSEPALARIRRVHPNMHIERTGTTLVISSEKDQMKSLMRNDSPATGSVNDSPNPT